MRVRGEELIPGEPVDEKELRAMIDAPIGDRSQWKPKWPELQDYRVPIGKGKVIYQGRHLTLVSWGRYVLIAKEVCQKLRAEGIEVELIDLRSLYPYDWSMIKNSVTKTGRLLIVNEDTEVTNFGEHLVYRATQELFYQLLCRPVVLAGKQVPGIGLHPHLEEASVPQSFEVAQAARQMVAEVP
jgi:2-oxoisovalerate dehydrogenase E1 component beta subunit